MTRLPRSTRAIFWLAAFASAACARGVSIEGSGGGGGDLESSSSAKSGSAITGASSNASSSASGGPKCGDGVVQADEECDDGNAIDTDACRTNCQLATCGDGVVESGVEQCDDGNGDDTDACRTNCMLAKCGDGVVETGVEACDDGNTVSGDGCSATCQSEFVVHGPNHTFAGMTSSFYITQFDCSNSGGDPAGDALYFCQHFYGPACTAAPGFVAMQSSTNPMMHSGTNCYSPDPTGTSVPGTSCVGGPCKIGTYSGPLGGIGNIVCNCPP